MASEIKSSGLKLKPSSGNRDGTSSSSVIAKNKVDPSAIRRKVIESSSKQSVDLKQKSASISVSKKEVPFLTIGDFSVLDSVLPIKFGHRIMILMISIRVVLGCMTFFFFFPISHLSWDGW